LRTLWVVVSIAIVVSGFVVAHLMWRSNQQVWAVGVIGLTTLLISPISWSHHYVVILIVLVALLQDAKRQRASGILALGTYAIMLAANVVFKLVPHTKHAEFKLHGWQVVASNQYVVIALVLLAYSALQSRRLYQETI